MINLHKILVLIALAGAFITHAMPASTKCTGILKAATSSTYDGRYSGPKVNLGSIIRFHYEGHLSEGVVVEHSGNKATVVWEDKRGNRFHSILELEETTQAARAPLSPEEIQHLPQSEIGNLSTEEAALWLSHHKPVGISEYDVLTTRPELRNKTQKELGKYRLLFTKEINALNDANNKFYSTRAKQLHPKIIAHKGEGWFHYDINDDKEGTIAPKLHLTLKNVLQDLTPATTESLLIDLQKAGFNGQLKVEHGPDLVTRFDPIVIHGVNEKDIEIAKEVLKSREHLFSQIASGADRAGLSNNRFRSAVAILKRDSFISLNDVADYVDNNFVLQNHRAYNLDTSNPKRVIVRGIYDPVDQTWHGENPGQLKTFTATYTEKGEQKNVQLKSYNLKTAEYLLNLWVSNKQKLNRISIQIKSLSETPSSP